MMVCYDLAQPFQRKCNEQFLHRFYGISRLTSSGNKFLKRRLVSSVELSAEAWIFSGQSAKRSSVLVILFFISS
ncbi:hypothetical protein Gasu2_15000 [Galdieria sulphuraria]|nr:hypothetical protein Gasu2_15000 [Galdieria sulphuraria]